MSTDEVLNIIQTFAELGVEKIRFTGGEPLLRKDIVPLIQEASQTDGIHSVCLTTNGVLLKDQAETLKKAGLDRVNISLDTVDPETYQTLTRNGDLEDTLSGFKAAQKADFNDLKINAVLIGKDGKVDLETVGPLIELTKENDVCVRFIELMPMGACAGWDSGCFIKSDLLLDAFPALEPAGMNGVSRVYKIPGYRGTIGLIEPMSHKFCSECNRVRVTADGNLKTCLHSADEINLRGLEPESLKAVITEAVKQKPASHHLIEDGKSSTGRNMNQIGG